MLPKTKFAITADSHIENNKNLPFVLKSFDWMIDTLKTNKIKYLLILGDYINSRFKIDVYALNKALDVLNKFYDAGIEVYILLGNHERYYRATNLEITSIKPFEKHSKIINEAKTIQGENFNFIFIPNVETNEELIVLVSKAKIDKNKLNILLAHCDIKGATTNDLYNIISKEGIAAQSLNKFNRVFLGHFHKRQEIGNILYVGSPVQLSHGEEFSDKGLTIWNAEDDSIEFIPYPEYEVYKTVVDLNENVKDKFVRYMTNEFIDAAEAKKIKEELYAKGAIDVKIDLKHKEFEEVVKEDGTEYDLKDVILKYIELNCNDLDKEKCYKTCIGLMKNET